MNTGSSLAEQWRGQAALARSIGAEPQALTLEKCAAELEGIAGTLRLTTGEPRALAADQMLTAPEAAVRLGVAPRWLYRHARSLPFTRRLGRKTLRFSERGLDRWMSRTNGGACAFPNPVSD